MGVIDSPMVSQFKGPCDYIVLFSKVPMLIIVLLYNVFLASDFF